jgi:hypothetical protein
VALRLREGLRDLYFQLGACHLQLGKYYPYQQSIGNPATRELLGQVKRVVDGKGLMNPGSLGLE